MRVREKVEATGVKDKIEAIDLTKNAEATRTSGNVKLQVSKTKSKQLISQKMLKLHAPQAM